MKNTLLTFTFLGFFSLIAALTCPSNEHQYLPDPLYCDKYYECVDGEAIELNCPSGLYWNQEVESCDFPANVDCTVGCPDEGEAFLPDPTDCSKYIKCVDGASVSEECPEDLYWNQAIESCDFPENVDCNASPSCPSTGEAFLPDPSNCANYIKCLDGSSTLEHCASGLYWNQAIESCDFPENVDCDATPTCPSTGEAFLPDPNNCANYIKCIDGSSTVEHCASGLYWNQEIESCDFPENVDCNSGPTTSPPTDPTDPTNTPTDSTGSTSSSICPEHGSGYVPYPGDCTMYYECSDGAHFAMQCPDGLYWNQAIENCDFPDNVDCDQSTKTTLTPPTDSTTQDGTCPSSGDAFFPYPYDCAKYYQCRDGDRTLNTCPNGLYWNQDILSCDFPQYVDCNIVPTTPDSTCPSSGHTFFPYPPDCTKYYECSDGDRTLMDCPEGLYWNQEIESCDEPENTDCNA